MHGLSRREISDSLNFDGPFAHPEGGWWHGYMETEAEISERVDRFVRFLWDYVAKSQPRTIVVFTHGLFMDSLVFKLLGVHHRDRSTTRTLMSPMQLSGNCSVSVFHLYAESGCGRPELRRTPAPTPAHRPCNRKKIKCDPDKHYTL